MMAPQSSAGPYQYLVMIQWRILFYNHTVYVVYTFTDILVIYCGDFGVCNPVNVSSQLSHILFLMDIQIRPVGKKKKKSVINV